MPTQELDNFISDAERTLRSLRADVLVGQQSNASVKIGPLSEGAATMRRAAADIGLHRVLVVLEAFEDELVRASAEAPVLDAVSARKVLDLIAYAEAEVVKCGLSQPGDRFDEEVFVDHTFELLTMRANSKSEGQDSSPAEEAPDPELMEVFSQEADELLTEMESNLEALAASPSAENSLWELRRHAHTFKGAAGMVGIEKAARLAHRMEDLLDRLSDSGTQPTADVLELLSASVRELRSLTGDGLILDTSDLTSLMDRFSVVLERSDIGSGVEPTKPDDGSPEAPEGSPEHANASVDDLKVQRKRPVVRVSIERLDEVINAFNEAASAGARVERTVDDLGAILDSLEQIRLRSPEINRVEDVHLDQAQYQANERRLSSDGNEVLPEICKALSALEQLRDALDASVIEQQHFLAETQRKLNKIRLIRFGSLTTRLQRTLQVACDEEGRQAELIVADPDVELDTDVLDASVEPIMHLIRNAVAHGIEPPETRRLLGKNDTGTITVRVRDKAAYVEISVEDDGRGIDVHALREKAANAGTLNVKENGSDTDLIFLPGLTTAEKLSMNSGRGIGMSIVKESVESRGGSVTFETRPRVGTAFTLRVPSGPAAVQVLIANCASGSVAVPSRFVKEVIAVESEDIHAGPRRDELSMAGSRVPVGYLTELFGEGKSVQTYYEALVADAEDGQWALLADHLLRTESVMLQPAGDSFEAVPGVLATAVLSSGDEVPVVDPSVFFKQRAAPVPEPSSGATRVMVVDDSPSVRRATAKAVARPGFSVMTATDGVEALILMENGPLPDLIITDVEMPRMDGFRFAAAVRADARLRHIPIVFITSRGEQEFRSRADELFALDYLTKPFVESELVGILDEMSAVRAGSLTLQEAC